MVKVRREGGGVKCKERVKRRKSREGEEVVVIVKAGKEERELGKKKEKRG